MVNLLDSSLSGLYAQLLKLRNTDIVQSVSIHQDVFDLTVTALRLRLTIIS